MGDSTNSRSMEIYSNQCPCVKCKQISDKSCITRIKQTRKKTAKTSNQKLVKGKKYVKNQSRIFIQNRLIEQYKRSIKQISGPSKR